MYCTGVASEACEIIWTFEKKKRPLHLSWRSCVLQLLQFMRVTATTIHACYSYYNSCVLQLLQFMRVTATTIHACYSYYNSCVLQLLQFMRVTATTIHACYATTIHVSLS